MCEGSRIDSRVLPLVGDSLCAGGKIHVRNWDDSECGGKVEP